MTTTYTITTLTDNETYLNCSPEMLKRLRKTYGTKGIKVTKSEAQKFWYYRGERVILHEDRQNNYTIISSADGSGKYAMNYASNAELEYR